MEGENKRGIGGEGRGRECSSQDGASETLRGGSMDEGAAESRKELLTSPSYIISYNLSLFVTTSSGYYGWVGTNEMSM